LQEFEAELKSGAEEKAVGAGEEKEKAQ